MKDKNREEFLRNLKQHGIENDIPNISFCNAKFLRDLIKIKKPKRILEIGTANGFSSLNMAMELQHFGGVIETIEFSEKSYGIAKENIAKMWFEKEIIQHWWNALDVVPLLEDWYDFIFIDGMKRRTKDFFELSYPKLHTGGIMIVDDVILFQDKMQNFYDYLQEEEITYNVIPIDVNDGVMMLVK